MILITVANEAENDLGNTDWSVNKEAKAVQKKNKPSSKKNIHFPNANSSSTNDLPSEALFSSKITRQVRRTIYV